MLKRHSESMKLEKERKRERIETRMMMREDPKAEVRKEGERLERIEEANKDPSKRELERRKIAATKRVKEEDKRVNAELGRRRKAEKDKRAVHHGDLLVCRWKEEEGTVDYKCRAVVLKGVSGDVDTKGKKKGEIEVRTDDGSFDGEDVVDLAKDDWWFWREGWEEGARAHALA